MQETSIVNKVLAFKKEYELCLKHSTSRQSSSASIQAFQQKLTLTMPFATKRAEEVMKNSMKGKTQYEKQIIQEDLVYFQDSKNERKYTLGQKDKKMAKLKVKQIARMNGNQKRVNKEKIRKIEDEDQLSQARCSQSSDEENSLSEEFKDAGPSTSTQRRKHRRQLKTGSFGFWPKDVLKTPEVVETAVRNNMSVTTMCEFTASLIRATDADTKTVNLSYAQVYYYRLEVVKTISQQIKTVWTPSPVLALHWDGKLMKSLQAGATTEERLPVLVSGLNGVKLLGVPGVQGVKGEKIGPKISAATV